MANHSGGDLFSRVAEAAQRAANDKAQYTEEIAQLQDTIEKYRISERTVVKDNDGMEDLKRENTSVRAPLSCTMKEPLMHMIAAREDWRPRDENECFVAVVG